MVEVMGMHKTEAAAKRQREALWEEHKLLTGVTTYQFSDYRFPAPKQGAKTPRRKPTR
jgi:hypothetical protein